MITARLMHVLELAHVARPRVRLDRGDRVGQQRHRAAPLLRRRSAARTRARAARRRPGARAAAGSRPRSPRGGSTGPRGSARWRSGPSGSGASRTRRARRPGSPARPPTRSITRSCRKRSSFACSDIGRSPISSRNSVPPLRESRSCPSVCLRRAGEGALLVAEELALEQVLGDRRAVDRDEARRRAAATGRAAPRASSSLPVPDSPRISTVARRRRDLLDRAADALHLRVAREDPGHRGAAGCSELQAPVLLLQLVQAVRALDGQAEHVGLERLGAEVVGARARSPSARWRGRSGRSAR